MLNLLLLSLGSFALYRGYRLWSLRKQIHKLGKAPGPTGFFQAAHLAAEICPTVLFGFKDFFINLNSDSIWRSRFQMYERFNATIICCRSLLLDYPTYYVSDADAIAVIVGDRFKFSKPIEMYKILSHYGDNVLITNGDDHRRHRRIAAPSFSENNTELVWRQSQSIAYDWFQNLDKVAQVRRDGSKATEIDAVHDLTRVTISIISSAAFGKDVKWTEGERKPSNHRLSFLEALTVASSHALVKALAPSWTYQAAFLPAKARAMLAESKAAYSEFDQYLQEMVEERLSSPAPRQDLLSLLLKHMAEDGETSPSKLTLQEVKSNCYIFMLAGHETTAHTLSYALGLLALHPEEQEKLYDEVKSLPEHPDFSLYPTLIRTMAVFNEALRLWPPVPHIPKYAVEDTVLNYKTVDTCETKQLFVPKDARILVDALAMATNPALWRDPASFKPDRFIDTPDDKWDRQLFLPFSAGNRSCLGQRFAQVESVLLLALVVKNYRLEPRESDIALYNAGQESFNNMKDRVLDTNLRITLTPKDLKVVLVRR